MFIKKNLLILFGIVSFLHYSKSQSIQLTSVSPDVFCSTGKDTMKFSINYAAIPQNSNIVFYQSTNPAFNPYLGQGDSIGFLNVGSNTSGGGGQITTSCPEIIGIFIDACDQGGVLREVDNEYMVITSGNAGFNVSNLKIQLPNSSINVSSCPFATPSAATMTQLRNGTCDATTLIAAGQGDFIPANAIVIIFTGRGALYNYNFSSYCSSGQPIYILQNSCSPGTANFVNNAPSSCPGQYRNTTITIGTCTDKLTYNPCSLTPFDASNPNANDGNYVIHLSSTDTSSTTNGGIRNNAADKCNGIRFDSISGATIIKIPIPNDGSSNTATNFCNTGYHYIKAITHPNGTQPVSNTIQYKLVCLDVNTNIDRQEICSGQSTNIIISSSSANATYNWIPSGGASITGAMSASGLSITDILTNNSLNKDSIIYTINANDDICTKTKQIKVIVNPKLPKPNLGNDTTICGSISKLLSTGNATTTWTLNNNPLANNVASITASQAGSYIASITGVCGNVADTIVITQSSTQPKPNLGKDTSFCGAVSKTLSTGIANTIWLKDNVQVAANTSSFTATQTGTYIANVTGSCGTASDTIIISQSPNINFDFGTNSTTVCVGGSISLDASNAYDQYLWNTGAVTNQILITTPGKYWVDVFKNGCKGTDTIFVTQINKPIKPNLGNDTAVCGSFSKTLISNDNATIWLKDNIQFAVNTSTVNVNQTGIYIAKITNSCGSVADTINIIQLSNVAKPNLGNDTAFCGNISKLLSTGNVTTTWFRDNVQIASNTSSITAAQVGTYVAVINGNCTSVSDTIVISQNSGLVKPFIGNDTSYCGNFSRILSTGVPQTIWKRNNIVVATSQDITITQGGTYTATFSNVCGTVADTIEINNTNALSVNLGRDTSLCAGQTLTLNATVSGSGITYTWNTGDVSPSISVPAVFKKYDVVVSNGICSATDTILIDSINIPNKPTLGNDTIFCGDFSLLLFTGDNTIWSTGVVGTQITVTNPGEYIAENRNKCGNAKDTINVTKFSLPNVNIGRDTSICDSIQLSVGNGIFNSIFWSTNDTTKSIVVSESGVYTVKVTNTNCSKIDSITIIRDCDFDVYLPTAFSPNNDNVNDVLVPLSYEKGIVVIEFIIYDRWSEKIFESKNFAPNDKNAGWKGLYKGEFAAVDDYAYYYLIKLPDGKIKSYKGTVALFR